MTILSTEKLTKSFGGLTAVSNVFMKLEEGELIGLIGPNGAGKTTLFNLLTGVYTPTSGSILFQVGGTYERIDGEKPYAICGKGVARTFQNIRLFKNLTVLDNVRIAMHKDVKYGIMRGILRTKGFHEEEERVRGESMELLKILKLDDKKDEKAKNLPYGEQRHLEIARALAARPTLLLLDEPAAGMNPAETAELTELISSIRKKFNLTILLIEHDMSLVMKICERIYVLDYGKIIANGTPEDIRSDKQVIEAYLGEDVSRGDDDA